MLNVYFITERISYVNSTHFAIFITQFLHFALYNVRKENCRIFTKIYFQCKLAELCLMCVCDCECAIKWAYRYAAFNLAKLCISPRFQYQQTRIDFAHRQMHLIQPICSWYQKVQHLFRLEWPNHLNCPA